MSRDSVTKLRRVASEFSEWLGCEANTGHFTEEIVERFLAWRGESLEPGSQEWLHKTVIRLWKYAAVEVGFAPPPFRLQKHVPNRDPIKKQKSHKAASRADQKQPSELLSLLVGLLGLSPSTVERLKLCVGLVQQVVGELSSARQSPNQDARLDRIEEMMSELRRGRTSPEIQQPAQQVTQPTAKDTSQRLPLEASSPLSNLVEEFIVEHALRGQTPAFHRSTVKSFDRFLRRPPLVSDLGEQSIEEYISWRLGLGHSPGTCLRVRQTVRGWWAYAAELRLLEPPVPQKGGEHERAECLSAIAAQNAEAAKDKPAMSLAAALEWYERERLARGSDKTKRQLRISAKRLEGFLGRPPMTSDLTEDTIRESMVKMHELGSAPRTQNKFRDQMLAMCRFLFRKGVLTTLPEVQAAIEPKHDPVAWSKEQLAKLWAACESQSGFIGEVPARLWWHALHAVAWNTGERISALLDVKRSDVDLEGGWVRVCAESRKGKRADQTSKLHPDTCALLRELFAVSSSPLVFPWPFTPCYLWVKYGKLLDAAGLPNDRQHKFHCIRKSAASWFDAAGGNAQQLLGHADARVTQKYLDPRIVRTTHAADVLFQPGKSAP